MRSGWRRRRWRRVTRWWATGRGPGTVRSSWPTTIGRRWWTVCRPATGSPGRGCTRSSSRTRSTPAPTCAPVSRSPSLSDRGDRVDVEFTDGDKRSYDLVVGADGLYSQVRETVFGPRCKPKYTGQVCWRYNLPRIEGLDKIWVYIGATGTAGFVPLAPDLMYILTIEKPPEGQPIKLAARRASPPSTASGSRSSAARWPSSASWSSTTTLSSTGRSRTCSCPRRGTAGAWC